MRNTRKVIDNAMNLLMRGIAGGAAAIIIALTAGIIAFLAPSQSWADRLARPKVIYPVRTDTSAPLRELPILPAQAGRKLLPRKEIADRIGLPEPYPSIDPVLDDAPTPAVGTTFFNFDGLNNRNGVLPPDTNGDIGPNHYVQWVNLSLQVWSIDRIDKTATSVYGPVDGNLIWAGFGGICETSNNGDPIVLYDQKADRWMISQFAFPSASTGPFSQCIAVSQTPDPTDAWYRYQFPVSTTKLNDYPHFGVWRDAYYMAINQFNKGSMSWGGQGVVAFERDKMLLGQSDARMVYFDLYSVNPNLGGMLPSDLDGATLPPDGTPNIFAEIDDNAWGYSQDQIQYWTFDVDWTNPVNSTFSPGEALPTAAFDTNMCGGARNCIPQAGTSAKLDAISDRLMYRLQYRNFGTYETLVANHTVDVNGIDRAGVRWYELRRPTGGSWSIFQQGTYSPDSTHRWMGSAAMNGFGQIALGYSNSSSTMYPSIRYTGRLADDPLGTMSQGDNLIIAGGGSQTSSYSRWGDYSSMSVDPVDDCTFWYTTEYVQATGIAPWRTRIASFRFPGCGESTDAPPSVSITNPAADATVAGVVNVTANAADDNGVTQVAFFIDKTPIGTDGNGLDGWTASWNTVSFPNGSHVVTATATDTVGQTGSDSRTVTVNNPTAVSVHVGDLDGTKSINPNKSWRATVAPVVHDGSHGPVSGAVVSFIWNGSVSGTGACTTSTTGQCSLTVNIPKNGSSVAFTVNNVTKFGATYNSDANHDPDGDSTGTTISITK